MAGLAKGTGITAIRRSFPVCLYRERQQENTVADVSVYGVPLDEGYAEPERR